MIRAILAFVLSIATSTEANAQRRPLRPFPRIDPAVVNGRVFQGEEIGADYPPQLHMRNIGSHIDGAGMCVTTSIEMSARFQGLDQITGLRDWAANEPGGASPDKIDNQLPRFAKAKGIKLPDYLQYEGPNPEKILDLCQKTGRMASITYGYSPRYGGQIAHMVCCPSFSAKFGVVMDNNFIGGVDREHLFEWMDRDEIVRRMKYPGSTAWVFVWLAPAPPPIPHN